MAEHVARFVSDLGIDTTHAIGLDDAMLAVRSRAPDVVLCEYDLLTTNSLDSWERDSVLSRIPIVAVSLTRRPGEVHLLDVNAIAGFLYLPTLREEDARRILYGAATHSLRVERGDKLSLEPTDTPGAA